MQGAEHGVPGVCDSGDVFVNDRPHAGRRTKREPSGFLLVLLVTSDCNLGCRYCYVSAGEKPAYMSWEVAEQVLRLLLPLTSATSSPGAGAQLPVQLKVQFSGGEPLLNLPLIERVVRHVRSLPLAQSCQVTFAVQTNATLMTLGVARLLKQLGIGVGVSLDGGPEVHDWLRPLRDGRGSFTEVIAGTRRLAETGTAVGITTVVCKDNVDSLRDIVDISSYLGNVVGISLDLLRPLGRASHDSVLPPDLCTVARELQRASLRADELAGLGARKVRFRELERIRSLVGNGCSRDFRCYLEAGRCVAVTPEGDMFPCASLVGVSRLFLGNVGSLGRSADPAQGALQMLEAAARGAQLVLGGASPGAALKRAMCGHCPYLPLCGGPCPAQLYAGRTAGEWVRSECALRTSLLRQVLNERAKTCHTNTSSFRSVQSLAKMG